MTCYETKQQQYDRRKLAADFLTKQGYEIIETNFRVKEGEVGHNRQRRRLSGFVKYGQKADHIRQSGRVC